MVGATATLDAGILAVPQGTTTPGHAHRFVEGLLDWVKLLDEPWVAIYMSERASEALIEDGLYTFRDELRRLFSAHGVVEYDVNTVAQVADRFLGRTPSFETYFRVQDALVDELTTTPDVLQLCTGRNLREDLARCIVLIAILRRHCSGEAQTHIIVLREAPHRVVRVRGLLHYLEHQRDDLGMVPSHPDYFEGEVLACDSFVGLLECIDECTVLRRASDDIAVELACRIAVFKAGQARGDESDWEDIVGWRVGRQFRDRAQRCCRDAPDGFPARLLRAVAEAIEGESLQAVHPLRIGSGGNDPQRRRARDNAKAWRRDVDYEYHLHYWELQDGSIELTSVGPHNDFSMPE